MGIKPLSLEEIKKMTRACRIAADTLTYLDKYIKVGMTTNEIDQLCNDFMMSKDAKSACLGYHGYPKYTCTSVNEVVCHGVPDDKTVLQDGDIINVDVTAWIDGFFGDTSKMYMIGDVSEDAKDLVETARMARDRGIEAITPNGWTGDIGFETNKLVTRKGYTTVKEIGGHGVGRIFHEEPFVPSFGKKGKGDRLVPFHCITVEPMVNQGTDEIIEYAIPGSSIKYYHTADGLLSAQFEHTVLVTDTGYEILTLP
ncbi:type I methionyl aminopeptidase [uncultured Bdellovibrio sp.]|uniref:type I methionyl aminopeptidase n=1 Tax=Bdellovibrio sp. HCB-162 TaxID=3394234 RepID=UPI0025DF02C4|nr:type I methionyl aminopeptidase [uncultured Bdellovibrio sp.]